MSFKETGPSLSSPVERSPQFELVVESGYGSRKDPTKEPPKQMEDAGIVDVVRGIACACDGMGQGAAAEYASAAAVRTLAQALADENSYPGLSCPLIETVRSSVVQHDCERLVQSMNSSVYREKKLPVIADRAEELIRAEEPTLDSNSSYFKKLKEHAIESNQTTAAFVKVFHTPEGKALAACVSVGDSRIYRRRNGIWTQLSRDHSYGHVLFVSGLIQNEIDPEQIITRDQINEVLSDDPSRFTARALTSLLSIFDEERADELPLGFFNHLIYESLGANEEEVHPAISLEEVQDEDELYVMTDGPYENLSPEDFERIRIAVLDGNLTRICNDICEQAEQKDIKPDDMLVTALRVRLKK